MFSYFSRQLKLYCWVYGEPSSNFFGITIDGTEDVDELREAIWTKNTDLQRVPARSLSLRKVSIAVNKDVDTSLCKVAPDAGVLLLPTQSLSACFPKTPADTVHLMVVGPSKGAMVFVADGDYFSNIFFPSCHPGTQGKKDVIAVLSYYAHRDFIGTLKRSFYPDNLPRITPKKRRLQILDGSAMIYKSDGDGSTVRSPLDFC
jgi:hypothetical protein